MTDKYRPITCIKEYGFARPIDVLIDGAVPWISHTQADFMPSRAYYLFRDLYLDAIGAADGKLRGCRIDISVRCLYSESDKNMAADMLADLTPSYGIQFVCYTESGAAFIKL